MNTAHTAGKVLEYMINTFVDNAVLDFAPDVFVVRVGRASLWLFQVSLHEITVDHLANSLHYSTLTAGANHQDSTSSPSSSVSKKRQKPAIGATTHLTI